jgi:cystathionine beta-lyase
MVDGRYRMDFELLEKQIDSKCKILILCNPHNPAGIMWDADTLRLLADICYERNILVVSDEIHADLILNKNQKHTPFATVSTRAEQNSITLMSGSKTFNIAGLFWSYSVIFNSDIHKKWRNYLEINGYNEGCLFASVALEAAYSNGQAWLTELLDYLRGNVAFITDYLQKNIPQIKPYIPQATYMMWLDCRQLGLPHGKVADLFVNKARLALNSGLMFGAEGSGFMRLNFATSRKNLAVALEQLKTAVEG